MKVVKIHFSPCYSFTNPMHRPANQRELAQKEMREEQADMKGKFHPQIMIDPEPASEKPWSAECENKTGLGKTEMTPGVSGPGQVFVLSDPAPFLEGGFKNLSEKARGDGSKDYWSICVVKLRVRGKALDIILLDGLRSQEWDHKDGARAAVNLMRKYQATRFFSENPKQHQQYMLDAALQEGVRISRARDGGPLSFKDYNKADGKNTRIMALAAKAKDREFWICTETCSDDFLYGNKEHTGFLTQVRKFRKVGPNKTNLRFDDDVDVVARATDDALLEFTPKPHVIEGVQPLSPYRSNDEEPQYNWGTRHVRA